MIKIKNILLLFITLFLTSCQQDEPTPARTYIANVAFEGLCSDKEQASPLKELDDYKVEGEFSVYPDTSLGYIRVTDEEKEERGKLSWPGHPTQTEEEYFNLTQEMNYFEKYKYWAREDTPHVMIYKISKEIFQNDIWNVDAYHSYIKDDYLNEDYFHYGYSKANCLLNITSREGTVSDELANQINWCFDSQCSFDSWR